MASKIVPSSSSSAFVHEPVDNLLKLPRDMQRVIFQFTDDPTEVSLAMTSLGSREIIQRYRGLTDNKGESKTKDCCTRAARLGYFNLLKWARTNGCPWDTETFDAAAEFGDIKVLEWLLANGCPWDFNTFSGGIVGGHIAVSEWLFDNGFPREELDDDDLYEDAITSDKMTVLEKITMLEWLLAKGFNLYERNFCQAAAVGDIAVLDWLLAHNCPRGRLTFADAIKSGKIEVLEWFLTKGFHLNAETFASAAERGDIAVLEWLFAHNCPWDESTFAYAFKTGNFEVLEWLRKHYCPWDVKTFANAIANAIETRSIKILAWLKDKGCPRVLSAEMCSSAAEAGNLELLKWLRAEGCPWNEQVFTAAVIGGTAKIERWRNKEGVLQFMPERKAPEGMEIEVLEWLHDNGCPSDQSTLEAIFTSENIKISKWSLAKSPPGHAFLNADTYFNAMIAITGNPELIKLLKEKGYPWNTETFVVAVATGNLELIKWLKAEGCPVVLNAQMFTDAVATGNLELAEWLKAEGCPWDIEAFKMAVATINIPFLDWLDKNGYFGDIVDDLGSIAHDTIRAAHDNRNIKITEWIRNNLYRDPD